VPLSYAEVDGVRLAYRVSGDPDGAPVVLLHALGEDSSDWDEVIPALPGHRRAYAVDLRGHGHSDRTGAYSLELMRDDVLGLLDALGLDRVTLVGHSMGAAVAFLAAQRRPDAVERLVLEEPPPFGRLPERPLPARPAEPLGFDWDVVVAVNRERNDPDPAWWDDLTAITAPTLVVAGGERSHFPQDALADLAARIPASRLVTIDAGHLVHVKEPARFVAEVNRFLTA
jgi:3-oxoadipate enol-lactonase